MCVPVGQRRTKTRSPPARDPIYIVFRRRNVSEIGHFFMDGVVEVKALDSMGVSSALSGRFFRTRLCKRNRRVVDLCSETVSPIDAGTNPSPIFTSRLAEMRMLGRAVPSAEGL